MYSAEACPAAYVCLQQSSSSSTVNISTVSVCPLLQASTMPNTGQLLLLIVGLGVLFGPDLYKAASNYVSASAAEEVDVDQGRSLDGRVHVAFCTS